MRDLFYFLSSLFSCDDLLRILLSYISFYLYSFQVRMGRDKLLHLSQFYVRFTVSPVYQCVLKISLLDILHTCT